MPLDVQKLARSPAAFRDAILIDTARGPVRLAEAIAANEWQREDFAALDAGWMQAAGVRGASGPLYQRAWLERPRGHSKTSDTAVSVAWCLFAAPRQRTGVLAAASKDQAGLLRTAVERLVRTNAWLGSYLEVQANVILNKHTGSRCDVLSSEAHTSWGLLVDFIAIDELTHWPNLELWYSLLSAIAKKEHGFLQVISNAGFAGSPQEEIYRAIQSADSGWWFNSLPGPIASWISRANNLEEQRRLLPAIVYDRVWLNRWTSGEDSAISDEDLKAAVTLRGAPKPSEQWRRDRMTFGGLDVGVKHDRSALVVLGVPIGQQRIQLAAATSWKPPRGGEVDLQAVEDAVLKAHRDYGLSSVFFDPAQAMHTAQRLRRRGVRMIEMTFVPKNLDRMAQSLMMVFRERQIELFEHRELLKDLRALRIEERMAGLRLSAVSGPDGHADLGIAFSIALPAAEAAANTRCGVVSDKPVGMFIQSEPKRHGVRFSRPERESGRRAWN